jgi:hypothetical protein
MKKSHDIEKEIMQINGGRERWENWMQVGSTIIIYESPQEEKRTDMHELYKFTQGYMVPTFTKRGFAVVKNASCKFTLN